MPRKIIMTLSALAVCATAAVAVQQAAAQLNNKPFSFPNSPSGGPGISQGGKQAIINEELFDSTPDNLQRGADGRLVDVVEGPGDSAIVFQHGTNASIPGFKGTSWRGDSPLMNAGVFNAYFGPVKNSTRLASFSYAQSHSGAMVSNWTTNVVSGVHLPPYYGNNPVDSWTAFVNSLNRM